MCRSTATAHPSRKRSSRTGSSPRSTTTIRRPGSSCSPRPVTLATTTGRSSNEAANAMSKTYMILGGGGSFGIHTAFYLLRNANPKKVIGVGRNLLRPEPFSLGIEREKGYEYHAYHLTYELDLLLELMDKVKPEIIVNYAAQG